MRDKIIRMIKKTSAFTLMFLVLILMLSACSDSRVGTEIKVLESSEKDSYVDESTKSGESDLKSENKTEMERSESKDIIYVHVCGAVQNPGVYELTSEDRVFRAIEAAGGLTKDADEVAINQAGRLEDGQQIYVYTKEEMEEQNIFTDEISGSSAFGEGESKKININTAGEEELKTLTGIGDAKAKAIIDYREVNGGFQSVEDLMEIDGIKEGVFRKIKDDITI